MNALSRHNLVNLMKLLRQINAPGPLIVLCLLAAASQGRGAQAHPMGNFSINHLSRIEARPDRIALDYRLDFAEIPTLAERNQIDRDGNDTLSTIEQKSYGRSRALALRRNLKLSLNDKVLPLRASDMQMQWKSGAGGLSTLRFIMQCSAPLPASARGVLRIRYADTNFATRAGWKEVVVVAGRGAIVRESNVPSSDVTRGLAVYPTSATPPQHTSASFQLLAAGKPTLPRQGQAAASSFRLIASDMNRDERALIAAEARSGAPSFWLVEDKNSAQRVAVTENSPNTAGAATESEEPSGGNSNTPQDAFTQSIAHRKLTPRLMLGGIFLALIFGAMHALSPGHGKTMVAAYLVGERGTWRHAALLGVVVTITHTLGVFLLGLGVWFASETVDPARLFPILSTASGLLIFGVGLWLLQQRLGRLSNRGHSHGHHHHDHDHDHGEHDHEHHDDHEHHHDEHSHDGHNHGPGGHSHVPQGPITVRALIALGVSGGIVPCPSALIVLLSAIALHRVAYGLVLISVFSLGLAGVLIAIGCAVVSAQGWINRSERFVMPPALSRLARYLPVASATAVTLIGLMLTWSALGPLKP